MAEPNKVPDWVSPGARCSFVVIKGEPAVIRTVYTGTVDGKPEQVDGAWFAPVLVAGDVYRVNCEELSKA